MYVGVRACTGQRVPRERNHAFQRLLLALTEIVLSLITPFRGTDAPRFGPARRCAVRYRRRSLQVLRVENS
jgi:hypothetical protein